MIDLSANSAKKATLASTDSVYLALIDSEGSVSNAQQEVAQFAQRASLWVMDSVKNADLSSIVKTSSATNLAASSAKRATT